MIVPLPQWRMELILPKEDFSRRSKESAAFESSIHLNERVNARETIHWFKHELDVKSFFDGLASTSHSSQITQGIPTYVSPWSMEQTSKMEPFKKY